MARCKQCHTFVPNGLDLCEECDIKNKKKKADESYLDQLLQSVIPEGTMIPKRNRELEQKLEPEPVFVEPVRTEEEVLFLDDFEIGQKELEPLESEQFAEPAFTLEEESVPEVFALETVSEEEPEEELESFYEEGSSDLDDFLELLDEAAETLKTKDVSNANLLQEIRPDSKEESISDNYNIFDDFDEKEIVKLISEELNLQKFKEESILSEEPTSIEESFLPEEKSEDVFIEDAFTLPETETIPSEELILEDELLPEVPEWEEVALEEDSMFAEIESALQEPEQEPDLEIQDSFTLPDELDALENTEEDVFGLEDKEEILQELDELIPEAVFQAEDQVALTEMDAGSLEDGQEPFDDLLNGIDGILEHTEDVHSKTLELSESKKKKSWFQKLFGNIFPDRTEEEQAAFRQQQIEEAAARKQSEENQKQKDEEEQAEAKKLKTEKAAEKEAAKKAKKAEKAEAAKKKKAEAEEQKKQKQEEMLSVVEIEEEEGRINRVGASILFVVFGALAIFIIIGTNLYTYNSSIKSANQNFEWQRYSEAYNDVYGLTLKPEDLELYDKIVTVMYVNKELNSYNNYYALGYYDEALDSLLKGLQRYDKYLQFAKMLGIQSDLDFVRAQIIGELEQTFQIKEQEAMALLVISDKELYTKQVLDITKNIES